MIGVGMSCIPGLSAGSIAVSSGWAKGVEKGAMSVEMNSGREKVGVDDVAGGGGRSQAASAMGTSGA